MKFFNLKFLLILIIFFKINKNRIFETPLYYDNCGYPILTNKYTEKIYNFIKIEECDDFYYLKEFELTLTGFNRYISGFIDRWGIDKNISEMFHGRESFEISDLFYDSRTPILYGSSNLKNNPLLDYEWTYIDGYVSPKYEMLKYGSILGLDGSIKISESKGFTFRARLPIQNIVIYNKTSWNDLNATDEIIMSIDDRIPKTKYDKSFLKKTLNGFFRNNKKEEWSNFNKFGIGDLNLELDYIFNIFNEKLTIFGMLNYIIPTATKSSLSYLSYEFGNGGHSEGRLGLQIDYELLKCLSLVLYGSYTHAFNAMEKIIASYKGSYAFGMQPIQTFANTSWNQFILSIDLVTKISKIGGFDIGYQFINKGKDNINPIEKKLKDAVGIDQEIDFSFMIERSNRIAQKLKFSLYLNINNDFQIEAGTDFIFKGTQIMRENEYFGRITYSY